MPPADSLLDRYLAAECSADERRVVEAWLAAEPDARALVAAIRHAQALRAEAPRDADLTSEWQRLARRIATAPAPATVPARPWRVARARIAGYAAAAVLLVAVSSTMLLRRTRPAPSGTAARVESTAPGGRRRLTLDDGSIVIVGPATTVRVVAEAGQRVIELAGVARFTVVHDAARPFVVRAAGVETTDLGTDFVVRAYPGDSVRVVAVTEGRVAVRAVGGSAPPTELGAADVARVSGDGRVSVAHDADLDAATAWADGRLVFDDVPLGDVAAELGRWFAVDVRVPDPALRRRRVSARYGAPTLDAVLAALAEGLSLRVARDGRVVTLSASAAR